MPVLPVKDDKSGLRDNNSTSADIDINVFGTEINTYIRRQKRHKTIIL